MKKEEKNLGGPSPAEVACAGSIAGDQRPHAAPGHTPGPWTVDNCGRDVRAGGIGGLFVARIYAVPHEDDPHGYGDEQFANAHLIAAAPELKDGCNALIGLIQLVCGRDDMPPDIKKALLCSHRMDEALAALAQAEGRSS